jgi:hypothetical protein
MTSNLNILSNRTPWPNRVRGYPKCLITSGFFTASPSTKTYTVEKQLYKKEDIPGLETTYSINKTMSMRHFRVLLELIDMVKGKKRNDAYEFSPGRLLERLGLQRTGAAYSDMKRIIEDLASIQIGVSDEFIESGHVTDSVTGLFTFIETGEFAYKSTQREELELDQGRAVWSFQFSELMLDLLSEDVISTIHTKILSECGRSPLTQWLYAFYNTHGADGKDIFSYRALKLAAISGLDKGYSATNNKLNNQLAHRIKLAVKKLKDLKVFKVASYESSNAKTDTYHAFNRLVKFLRFTYDHEEELALASMIDRSQLFDKLLT